VAVGTERSGTETRSTAVMAYVDRPLLRCGSGALGGIACPAAIDTYAAREGGEEEGGPGGRRGAVSGLRTMPR
jgi:hypothetical protein